MEIVHVRVVVQPDGSVHINDLPFHPGEEVEVTVLAQLHIPQPSTRSSLEDSVLNYIDPTEPVAEDDWEVLK